MAKHRRVFKQNFTLSVGDNYPLGISVPADTEIEIVQWGVSFKGTDASATPCDVELLRATGGTSAASPPTPSRLNKRLEAPVVTIEHEYSANPTDGDLLAIQNIHPQGGGYEEQRPFGAGYEIGGTAIEKAVVKINAGAAVDCDVFIEWVE